MTSPRPTDLGEPPRASTRRRRMTRLLRVVRNGPSAAAREARAYHGPGGRGLRRSSALLSVGPAAKLQRKPTEPATLILRPAQGPLGRSSGANGPPPIVGLSGRCVGLVSLNARLGAGCFHTAAHHEFSGGATKCVAEKQKYVIVKVPPPHSMAERCCVERHERFRLMKASAELPAAIAQKSRAAVIRLASP